MMRADDIAVEAGPSWSGPVRTGWGGVMAGHPVAV